MNLYIFIRSKGKKKAFPDCQGESTYTKEFIESIHENRACGKEKKGPMPNVLICQYDF